MEVKDRTTYSASHHGRRRHQGNKVNRKYSSDIKGISCNQDHCCNNAIKDCSFNGVIDGHCLSVTA